MPVSAKYPYLWAAALCACRIGIEFVLVGSREPECAYVLLLLDQMLRSQHARSESLIRTESWKIP